VSLKVGQYQKSGIKGAQYKLCPKEGQKVLLGLKVEL